MSFQSEKYSQLLKKVEECCARCQRDVHEVNILAATKYASLQDMEAAIEAGIKIIGENKIQDAEEKFTQLSSNSIFQKTEKHFIGHLQTNKAKKAVQLFDVIESIDSLKLLEYINKEGETLNKKIRVLLEVNIAEDLHKFGFQAAAIKELLQQLPNFTFISVEGLMTIVPFFENKEESRPYFKAMKKLFDETKTIIPSMQTLSMGMSHDFEIAIEEGSTEIRIGSYLFNT